MRPARPAGALTAMNPDEPQEPGPAPAPAPRPPRPPARRLTLFDAMILVAAAAAGMALAREFLRGRQNAFVFFGNRPTPWQVYLNSSLVFGVAARLAAMLALGLL